MRTIIHVCKRFCSSTSKILIIILVSLFFSSCLTSATQASKITKDKTFPIKKTHVQGATLTRQYYVYTDWTRGTSTFSVTRCDRPSGKNCKSTSDFHIGKPASMYHVWGTNYVQAITSEAANMACIDLSTMKETSQSNCGPKLKSTGLNKEHGGGDVKDWRQGWTQYGNIFLRGYGINSGDCHIWLFTSRNGNPPKDWSIPTSGEVEDVMVDGDTGTVWFAMIQGAQTVTYYKVDQSVFSQWVKPGAAGGGGGTYVDPTSDPDNFYDDSAVEVRDETRQHETATSSYDGSVDTNFFGPLQDDNEGCGVYMVLNTTIDILTYGIAIAATIGIAISGIVYLNAKGDQQRTLKAKRRIYEIVIGLTAYAVLYSALNFLLPGGNFNSDKTCEKASETSNAVAGWHHDDSDGSDSGSTSGKKSKAQTTKEKTEAAKQAAEDAKLGTSTAGRKLMTAAEELAGKLEANKFVYSKKNQSTYAKALKKDKHVDCAKYVSWAMQSAGLLKSGKTFYLRNGVIKGSGKSAVTNNSKLKITKVSDNVANLVKKGKLVPGDIIGPDYLHTLIYQGKRDGKYYYYSVGKGTTKKGIMNKKKITNKTYSQNGKYRIKIIIHPI